MDYVIALFQSYPFFLLPAPAYFVLYILDLGIFVYGLRLIARRTFPYSVYTFGFAFLSLPDIILYPTDRSPINVYATSEFFYPRYMKVIDKAFVLTSIGYLILVLTIRFGSQYLRNPGRGRMSRSIRLYLSSNTLGVFLAAAQIGLLIILLAVGVTLDSARLSGFQDTSIRPFTVAASYLSTFSLTIFFARVFYKRDAKNLIFLAISIAFCLTLGVRSALFGPLMFFIFMYAWWNKSKNLVKYVLYALAIIPLVELADVLRTPGASKAALGLDALIASVFYGNTFSDLRDFSWMMSGWDGSLLMGKTYFAAALGFIPSFLFPLRQAWDFGPVSLQLSGLYIDDPHHVHPGLRGTFLAEAYFNFGVVGIFAISVLYGMLFLYDYAGVREAIERRDKLEYTLKLVRYQFVISLVSVLITTPAFSYGYFLIVMLALAYFVRKI